VPPSLFQEGERAMSADLLAAVSNYGFPIVVSLYLLIRIEGKLADLTESIVELAKAVAVIKAG